MNASRESVRASSSHMDTSELLKQPVTELLGVTSAAAEALQPLGIETVFDLGCSWIFANARTAAFALGDGGPAASHGTAPGDLLHDGVAFEALEDVGRLPLDAMRGLGEEQAEALANALDVDSLRDLALWPPHVFAKSLVNGAIGGSEDPDVLQTERLRPKFGEFPTERVYYTTLAMLRMNESAADGMRPLDGGVSLDGTLALRNGFTKPAVGALLTYSQSWYVQGTTFGHLLHSLALAPGEATRITVVDWARRTTATATESITEAEQLDTASSHARAISEVQNAVASEMQEGGSMSTSHAESSSNSAQATIGTGLMTSLYASGDASVSTQSATTDTTASSSSWSIGNRSVAASMSQNINDRTEQHSTSVRNRRATAVREVSQSEHEQVSTRVVANYDHMHALTVQYYEIVQVYRVSTRLHRAERCLFVPMERIDFGGPKGAQYVERFRGALVRAALNRRVRDLLLDDASAVEITPTSAPITMSQNRFELVRAVSVRSALNPLIARVAAPIGGETPGAAPAPATPPVPAPAPETPRRLVWDVNELALASRFLTRPLVRPGSDALFAPDDTELLGISFDGVTIAKLRLDRLDPRDRHGAHRDQRARRSAAGNASGRAGRSVRVARRRQRERGHDAVPLRVPREALLAARDPDRRRHGHVAAGDLPHGPGGSRA